MSAPHVRRSQSLSQTARHVALERFDSQGVPKLARASKADSNEVSLDRRAETTTPQACSSRSRLQSAARSQAKLGHPVSALRFSLEPRPSDPPWECRSDR